MARPRHSESLDRQVADHALDVLLRKRDRMPLTVGFMQAVSEQGFGHKVGQARAAAMIQHLIDTKRLTAVGRYRGRGHGFWVTIYKVIHRSASVTSSVLRNSRVKSQPWWQHPLFGGGKADFNQFRTRSRERLWKSRRWKACERLRESELDVNTERARWLAHLNSLTNPEGTT